jgi:hypothetical protein
LREIQADLKTSRRARISYGLVRLGSSRSSAPHRRGPEFHETLSERRVPGNLTDPRPRLGVLPERIQIFVTDMDDRLKMDAVRRAHFGDSLPAATLVEVSKLALPGAVVEVNAIAVSESA